MYKRRIVQLTFIIAVLLIAMIVVIPQQTKNALLVLDNKFIPATTTYSNKTMHFQVADPYDGYSHWTYEFGGTVQGPSDNLYVMDTDVSGYAEYFGFDEFVNNSLVMAEVIFSTSLLAGTYHFQPLAYFYQKTALESNTHWALAIDWDVSGIDLYYNTANGSTPTSVNLVSGAPSLGTNYRCTISNLGSQTFVEIQDISTYPTYPIIYSGYTTTTGVYDASVLYAGFGQYSSGNGHIYGAWDDFTISDVILSVPTDGTGFDTIGAYIDEVYTHTFYDIDEGTNSSLEIDVSTTNITLLVQCWLNGTAYDASSLTEGKNLVRHDVTVRSSNGTIVFSQTNFTYLNGFDYGDNLFWLQYAVELDFTVNYGTVYTVTVTYEVYVDLGT